MNIRNCLNKLKTAFFNILNETKAECSFNFNIPDISTFTKEQKNAFNQMIDFLADMVEKYSDKIPTSDTKTERRLNKKSA
ncbi:MAG: hypothetical protein ACI4XE_04445 [Acutalibacteraceae bacterium]